MRYSFISAAVLAFAASVLGQEATDGFDQITSPVQDQKVQAGKSFDIVWVPGKYTDDSITVTIDLLQGPSAGKLDVGKNIAKGVSNKLGKFSWNVPSDAAGFATYGIRIKQEDIKSTTKDESTVFQYSFPFHITASGSTATGAETLTVQLGTGSAYTPPPTSTHTSTSLSASKNITTSTISASVTSVPTPISNVTIVTTVSTVRSTTKGPSPTSTPPPQQTANAAMANAVSGSIALIGGAILAFAL